MRELLAQAQGNAAHRRVELRLDVHQSARRSRRASHRGGGPQGHRIGDIMVSPKHANFLVNVEAATAADVEQLVALIQQTCAEVRRDAHAGIPHVGEAR
jgi:hypothetical protein